MADADFGGDLDADVVPVQPDGEAALVPHLVLPAIMAVGHARAFRALGVSWQMHYRQRAVRAGAFQKISG